MAIGGDTLCLWNLSASNVSSRDEGSFGTSDPVLWVILPPFGHGRPFVPKSVVQMTAAAMDTLTPRWDETLCVPLAAADATPQRTCFEIHDDFQRYGDPFSGALLHFGCSIIGNAAGRRSVKLGDASLSFSVGPSPPPQRPGWCGLIPAGGLDIRDFKSEGGVEYPNF